MAETAQRIEPTFDWRIEPNHHHTLGYERATTTPLLSSYIEKSSDGITASPNGLASFKPLSHGRASTAVKVAAPLPAFTFHSSTPAIPVLPGLHCPVSSSAASQSPAHASKRHRRAVSELQGNISRLQTDTSTFIKQDLPTQLTTSITERPPRRHQHRRSAALSSQDIPFITSDLSSVNNSSDTDTDETILVSTSELPRSPIPPVLNENPSKCCNSRTVGFVDSVEVIPRPSSLVSLGSNSSQSTIRNVQFNNTASTNNISSVAMSASGKSRAGTMDSGANYSATSNFPNTTWDATMLSEDFDDNPTAVIVTDPAAVSQWCGIGTVLRDSLLPNNSISLSEPTNIIDLDAALEDVSPPDFRRHGGQPLSGRNRSTMYNTSGSKTVTLSGLPYHRRAESVPLMVPSSFPTTFHHGLAYRRGFGMDNVFEEDEDDHPSNNAIDLELERISDDTLNETPVVSRGVTAKPVLSDCPEHQLSALLPAIQIEHSATERHMDGNEIAIMTPNLSNPHRSFAASDLILSSTTSSPKLYPASGSFEPSAHFQRSLEDVPSLLSSGSTIESAVPSTFLDDNLASLDVGYVSPSSFRPSDRTHRKRTSVISISRLIGVHTKNPSLPAYSHSVHLEADDLSPSNSHSRTRRLGRFLRFWHHR